MKRVQVDTANPYSVLIGSGAVDALCEELPGITRAKRLMIVTDETVAQLHLNALKNRLRAWEVYTHILPAGEKTKTMETLMPLLQGLLEKGFDRSDAIVALGGGVVGDMAGFAASIYMRGMDFINIPTTLLSQVDSSVGGKTGVDLLSAKNILGAFHQPRLVICDTDYLHTLPAAVFADGCAEVIKYAFIGDEALLPLLDGGIRNHPEEIVYRCVQDKAAIVAEDEFDRGRRGLLNFGHTIGHAVEQCSNYTVSHGAAVAMGMAQMMDVCQRAGLCETGVLERLLPLLKECGLASGHPYSPAEITAAARQDKKKGGEEISVILPKGLCRCEIVKMSFARFQSLLEG